MRLSRRLFRRRLRLVGILLLSALTLLLHFRYLPAVRALAAVQVDNRTSDLINQAIEAYLSESQIRYGTLVRLEKSGAGTVAAMQLNMDEANRLRAHILQEIDRRVPNLTREEVGIPLGNVLLPALLSGHGAYLPVRVVTLRASNAELESRFTAAGINQTLHALELAVSVEVLILSPAGLQELQVNTRVPVAQTVLVGDVPNTLISTGE